jgi:hypothetical protein
MLANPHQQFCKFVILHPFLPLSNSLQAYQWPFFPHRLIIQQQAAISSI